MKLLFSPILFFVFSALLANFAQAIPPRAYLEHRLRSPTGRPMAVILSATIPADVCNDYRIDGEFLPIGEPDALPEFPTFYGDVLIVQTARLCPGSPPVMVNIQKTFRFDPSPGEDEHLILLIPAEFQVVAGDILE